MKKIEFSKFILGVEYFTAIIFSLFTVYVALSGGDAASIANITLAIWGVYGVGSAMYYNKAKAENVVKLSKKIPQNVLDKINDVGEFLD